MYFGVRVVVKRSVLDYTWLSAVAELGGYVGLWELRDIEIILPYIEMFRCVICN